MEQISNNKQIESEVIVDYKNPKLSPEKRTADLIKRMTLEEKVAQMLCIWEDKKTIFYDENGNFSLEKIREHLSNGIGQIARLSDTNGGLTPTEMVEMANTLQKFFVEETRLGIPVIFHEECLHGLAAKEATSYPVPIGLASTFNTKLVEKIFSAIAEDARTRGVHQALTPVLDVARDPRWGRVEETFGEDPYLIAQMGIAAVKGLQGDGKFDEQNKVIATLKHFAAHGQPESGINCAPANFSERILRDVFLYPFKEVIKKANAVSVMASYNEIDGVPSHANKWLLKKVLRDEWNFKGYVVSDYYAIKELNIREEALSHSVAKDKAEAAKLAVEAGVNIEFPNPDCYLNLVELVKSGIIHESDIDELIEPMLRYKFQLGLFDNPYIQATNNQFEEKLIKDRELALQAARETIVLLKNENNVLPLRNVKSIAVIGPNADRVLLGGYHGTPKFYISVYQGIKEKANNNIEVLYSEGCKITIGGSWNEDEVVLPKPEDDELLIKEAIEVAKKSEVIVLAIGGNEQTSREAWSKTHLGDRPNLDLVGRQNKLVEEMLKLGKPVIVLLFNGRPNSINYIKENAHAILECWYLGQETGKAVADVLFGDYNPSGKLPISIPRSAGHIPCYYNYKPSARRGYLFDDVTPLFPFGFGMSYTKFKFINHRLTKDKIKLGETTQLSVVVQNVGDMAGEEVVQLYIRDIFSSVTRPVKELKGFKKIKLQPGESKTVIFDITPELLSFTNIDMEFTVEPGEFEIMVGNSSRDEDLLKTNLTVE
ncbi:MAG: glycoside hydrolase family 3 N-terminal domain-containing protein [Melioribacter sp.]|uniref:glycoside hydrolase family 3 N-terminal domain-containing protein n=1 Tax=Rosettibacter primus TaxID=3111523 RepID=UPI00247CB5FB|nr:glycoside hydrolase family 3 N-terminal domain-containing protein [Melioribacter sp.]